MRRNLLWCNARAIFVNYFVSASFRCTERRVQARAQSAVVLYIVNRVTKSIIATERERGRRPKVEYMSQFPMLDTTRGDFINKRGTPPLCGLLGSWVHIAPLNHPGMNPRMVLAKYPCCGGPTDVSWWSTTRRSSGLKNFGRGRWCGGRQGRPIPEIQDFAYLGDWGSLMYSTAHKCTSKDFCTAPAYFWTKNSSLEAVTLVIDRHDVPNDQEYPKGNSGTGGDVVGVARVVPASKIRFRLILWPPCSLAHPGHPAWFLIRWPLLAKSSTLSKISHRWLSLS